MHKIIHLADTHIRLVRYHDDYRFIFDKLYEQIRLENPDFIVHCGDIVHNKITMSPELIPMVSDFLKNLADIAPTYVIPGNHDGVLKNTNRMDAITPIAQQLNHPQLHYTRNSVIYQPNDDITLHAWSPFDKDNWSSVTDNSKINICLFHGSVTGVTTDIGYTFEEGELNPSNFNDFDYAFLGDIHKSDQSIDDSSKKRYVGSTIQQNFGETDDKGFLAWEIHSKNQFTTKHVKIPHPRPFVTIDVDENGELPKNLEIQEGSRVRLMPNSVLPFDRIKYLTSLVQTTYRPEYVNFVNKNNNFQRDIVCEDQNIENIRELVTQELLLKEFIKKYQLSENVRKKIFELNETYNKNASTNDESLRNFNYNIRELKWSNLYNYGPNNQINFDNLSGVVGVFGKNYSGKSSIFDGLLLGMHNSDSKASRKNLHYVNENKELAEIEVSIGLGEINLNIQRKIEKYVKKNGSKEMEEARVDVEFFIHDLNDGRIINKTQETRSLTDSEIQRYIGSLDNFLLSSMAAQNRGQQFLELGPTDRKKIIAKFLDLDFFDKKYYHAKERLKELQGIIKNFGDTNFTSRKSIVEEEKTKTEQKIIEQKSECLALKQQISELEKEIHQLEPQINNDLEVIDIDGVLLEKDSLGHEKTKIQNNLEKSQHKLRQNRELIKKYSNILEQIDIEEVRNQKRVTREKFLEISKQKNLLSQQKSKFKMEAKKTELLEQVPCGSEFSHCQFIENAWQAKESLSELEENVRLLKFELENLEKMQWDSEETRLEEFERTYEQSLRESQKLSSENDKIQWRISEFQSNLQTIVDEIIALSEKEESYKQNQKQQQKHTELQQQIAQNKKEIDQLNKQLTMCEAKHLNLHGEIGRLNEQNKRIVEEETRYNQIIEEYSANEILSKAYHPKGIQFSIIKQKLPIINDEIKKCLHGIVDFDVFLSADNKKLEIYIQHPKYNPRPIEGCSGAEKALASMAFRLALLSVSHLPKSNIFILDEPGTSLDEDNLDGFVKMLQMIKENFQVVFLISHMETLKDVVDSIIEIDNVDGYAHVNI